MGHATIANAAACVSIPEWSASRGCARWAAYGALLRLDAISVTFDPVAASSERRSLRFHPRLGQIQDGRRALFSLATDLAPDEAADEAAQAVGPAAAVGHEPEAGPALRIRNERAQLQRSPEIV